MAVIKSYNSYKFFTHTGGINEKTSPALVPDTDLREMLNWNFKKTGQLSMRRGFDPYGNISTSDTSRMRGIFQFVRNGTTDELLVLTNTALWKNDVATESASFFSVSFNTPTSISFGGYANDSLSTNEYAYIEAINNVAYITNGVKIYSYDGTAMRSFGYYPPSASAGYASHSTTGGGLSQSSFVGYAFTFSRSSTGYESNPRDVTDDFVNGACATLGGNSVSIALSGLISSSIDPKFDTVNIFRTFTASSSATLSNRYFYVDSVSIGATTYYDTKANGALGRELSFKNYPLARYDASTGLLDRSSSGRIIPYVIKFHSNRLWAFEKNNSVLYFSEINAPESYSPENQLNVSGDKNDNQVLTGLGSLYDELVIFKERSVFVLRGDSPENFVLKKVSDNYGCISPRSVRQVENNLIFYSQSGWCAYTYGGTVERISDKLEETVDNLINVTNMSAVQFVDDKQYWCSAFAANEIVVRSAGSVTYTLKVNDNGDFYTETGGSGPQRYTIFSDQGDAYEIGVLDDGTLFLTVDTDTGKAAPILKSPNNIRWMLKATQHGEIQVTDSGLPDDTDNEIEVFDYTTQAWFKYATNNPDVDLRVLAEGKDIYDRPVIYTGGTGKIFRYSNKTNFNDSSSYPINSTFTSKWYDLGDPNVVKIYRQLQLSFEEAAPGYTAVIDTYYDYDETVYSSASFAVSTGIGQDQWRLGLRGNAKAFSFKCTIANADQQPKILGWTIYGKVRAYRDG